jgi:hypothetical protein
VSQLSKNPSSEWFIVADTDMNPLRSGDGSFLWDRISAESVLGTVPETGFGFPADFLMPMSDYMVTWNTHRGRPGRWMILPRANAYWPESAVAILSVAKAEEE